MWKSLTAILGQAVLSINTTESQGTAMFVVSNFIPEILA